MTIEERLEALEKKYEQRIADLELEVRRAQAVNEIQNLVGSYALYYSAQKFNACAELFAPRDDVIVDLNFGEFHGKYGAQRVYDDDYPLPTGLFRIHSFNSPTIQVAADGKTAKGTWISPGINTEPNEAGDKAEAFWCWIKYRMDFINEGGKWYIWHIYAYGLFNCNYYTSWADSPAFPMCRDLSADMNNPERGPKPRPDRDPKRRDWTYAIDRRPVLEPAPPQPYNSWDE